MILCVSVYFCNRAMFLFMPLISSGKDFTYKNWDYRAWSFLANKLLVKYSWMITSIYYLLNFVPGPPVLGVNMLQNYVLDRSLSTYFLDKSNVLFSFSWFSYKSLTLVSSSHILCGSIFSSIFWKSSPILRLFNTEFMRLTYIFENIPIWC